MTKLLHFSLVCVVLAGLSFLAIRSLAIPGLFTSHDLEHHIIRQIEFDRLFSHGYFPPRWSDRLLNGWGYPLFNFQYFLPYLAGEIFISFGWGFIDAVKLVLALSVPLGMVGTFLAVRALTEDKFFLPLAAALFYIFVPIRFSNLYVVASVGASLALAIVPWVFWSLIRASQSKNSRWLAIGSLLLAALVMSHNVTALMFFPVFIIIAIFLRQNLGSFLLALLLSAFFWLPALAETQFTRYSMAIGRMYADNFPHLRQLIYSPWGYGLSNPNNPEPGGMSFQLGLAQIAVFLLALFIFAARRGRVKGKQILLLGGGFFAVGVLLMLQISLPLWDHLPLLALVQFPVRFEYLTSFCAVILLIFVFQNFGRWRYLVVFGLVVLAIYANRNHWRINQTLPFADNYYQNSRSSTTSWNEQTPLWAPDRLPLAPTTKFSLILGRAVLAPVRTLGVNNYQLVVTVEDQPATLRFNQLYYPGWEIRIDGQPAEIDFQTEANGGIPVFTVNRGEHLVEARFVDTPLRQMANLISLVSLIVVGGLLVGKRR